MTPGPKTIIGSGPFAGDWPAGGRAARVSAAGASDAGVSDAWARAGGWARSGWVSIGWARIGWARTAWASAAFTGRPASGYQTWVSSVRGPSACPVGPVRAGSVSVSQRWPVQKDPALPTTPAPPVACGAPGAPGVRDTVPATGAPAE